MTERQAKEFIHDHDDDDVFLDHELDDVFIALCKRVPSPLDREVGLWSLCCAEVMR